MTAVPLEEQGYVIIANDQDMIGRLRQIARIQGNLHSGILYYAGICLKVPPGMKKRVIAELAAKTGSPRALTAEFGTTVVQDFTSDLERALDFQYDTIKEETEKVSKTLGVNLSYRPTGKKWYPF